MFALLRAFELCYFRDDWHIKSMSVLEESSMSALNVDQEYRDLLNEIEYHCSICQAVLEDVQVLNSKIESVYRSVTEKTRNNRNQVELVKHWVAAFFVASEIKQAVCMKKELNQICGIDSTTIDEVHEAIRERLEFLLGFSLNSCE